MIQLLAVLCLKNLKKRKYKMIYWADVATSGLKRIGEDVRSDRELNQARRQRVIDVNVENMFSKGQEVFDARKIEREGLSEHIRYFQSLGLSREDIRKLAHLPQEKLEELESTLQEGQAHARYENKPFDAYEHINMQRTTYAPTSNAEILKQTKGLDLGTPVEIQKAVDAISMQERYRLMNKAKEVGIPYSVSGGTFEQNRTMGREAILKIKAAEEAVKTPYNKWEDGVVQGVMGTLGSGKTGTSKEEKSFGDNFRDSLRKQFGWAGGEPEEALQTAASFFPGKTEAELQAALEDSWERETIEPPQYTVPLGKIEQGQIKAAEISLKKARLELGILTDAKAQDDQPMSALRTQIGNAEYGTIDGELVSGDLTVGKFRQLKKMEQENYLAEAQRLRAYPQDTPATASRNVKSTYTSLATMTGADSPDPAVYDSISWLKDPEYPEITAQNIAIRANFDVNTHFSNRDNYAKMLIRNNLARDMFIAKVYMDIKSNTIDEDTLNTVIDNIGNKDTVKSNIANEQVAAFILGLPNITKDTIKNNKDVLRAMLTGSTGSNYSIPITTDYVENMSEEKTDHHIYKVAYTSAVSSESLDPISGQWDRVLTPDVMDNLFTDDGFLDVRKFGAMFDLSGIDASKLYDAKLTRETLLAALNSDKYLYD